MIYDMIKPSANMNLSNSAIAEMIREQQTDLYNAENEKLLAEQSAIDREREEYYSAMQQREKDLNESYVSRSERLSKIKEAFVSECIYRLFKESYGMPMTARDKVVARNLVNRFVAEHGAGELISSFSTKSMILSEFSRISQKYYDQVVESACRKECGDANDCNGQIGGQVIDQRIVDDFYKDLEEVDIADASKAIKDRVADAITDFVDSNAASKVEYEDIIKQAQDKIDAINGGADESVSESYINMAKAEINRKRATKERNIFGYMVEALTTSVFKDEALKTRFVHEASVDMDGIVNSTQLIYTMLEMVNTTNMVNVDEEFITGYLANL